MAPTNPAPTGFVFGYMGKYWEQIADADATDKQLFLVQKIFSTDTNLMLDLGCGTGRHVVNLCKFGYNIIGLDISKDLLYLAKQRSKRAGVNCEFVRADMRLMPFRSNLFAAIISLDTSFGYLPSKTADLEVLIEVKRILTSCGQLLMDVFNKNRMVKRFGQKLDFKLEMQLWFSFAWLLVHFRFIKNVFARLLKWLEYPDFYLFEKRIVDVRCNKLFNLWLICYKQSKKLYVFVHIVRLYDLPHLQSMFKNIGFHVESVYGNYKTDPYEENSNKLIILAKK
jgi:ubiquinone/menaquinone biosynthesis C-methylase UbiE